MSYILIPSNFDWTNIPNSYENSTLEIQDAFDLSGLATIQLPKNVTLVFNLPGIFSNGTINFNDTKISTRTENLTCFENCTFEGTLLQQYIEINWFGVKTGVQKVTGLNVSGTNITLTGYDFSSDIGKKIQIYKAGTLEPNDPTSTRIYSFQTEIATGGNGSATLVDGVQTNQNDTIALIGNDSGKGIENVLSVSKKIPEIRFHGDYLIAKSDQTSNGDLVPSTAQARLDLGNSNTVYNFSGSVVYGMVFVTVADVSERINNTIVKDLEVYSLGDGLDASDGNTNWNSLGVLAGDNNIFENSTIRMNGGVRALSIQSSDVNSENEITNAVVNEINIIGEFEGNKSDGIDISTNNGMINNINVSNVTAINVASILIARNVNNQFKIKNINCTNIQGKDIYKVGFRYSFVDGGNINNVKIRRKGTADNSPFLIQNSDGIVATDIDIYNEASSILHMVSLADNGPLTLGNISIVNNQIFTNESSDPGITNNALFLGSNELVINNLYVENFENVFWKFGRSALIKGVVVKNTPQIYRDNTTDVKLVVENLMELNGTQTPLPLNDFKAQALACFSGLSSPITPLSNSRNIQSIVKNAIGTYTITFTTEIPNYPGIISGQGRFYGGTGKFVSYRDYPTVATGKKTIKVICQNPNGTLADSDLITVIVF